MTMTPDTKPTTSRMMTKMIGMMITSTEEVTIEKTMMSRTGLIGMIIGVMLTRASEGVEDSSSRRR
jgi:hypothetical protein